MYGGACGQQRGVRLSRSALSVGGRSPSMPQRAGCRLGAENTNRRPKCVSLASLPLPCGVGGARSSTWSRCVHAFCRSPVQQARSAKAADEAQQQANSMSTPTPCTTKSMSGRCGSQRAREKGCAANLLLGVTSFCRGKFNRKRIHYPLKLPHI